MVRAEGAAPGAGAALALDIEDAARRAAEGSPLVRRARAERRFVEARHVGADIVLPANPVVAFGAGPTREATGRHELGLAAHVEQTVEVAGQRGTRRAEVARAVDAALAREELARVEARARAQATYVAALLATAQLDAARHREELAIRIEDSVRDRVRTGAASDIELHLATLERGRVQRDRVDAGQATSEALAALREIIFVPAAIALSLTTPIGPPTGELPAADDALAIAMQQRADLRALAAERTELGAAIIRLRREALPSPTVFLDVERDRPGELLVRAGVGLPLPLWRRGQGEVALAVAEQGQLDEQRVLVEREVAREVGEALRAVANRRAQVDLDDRDVVPSAEAALELLTLGWRAGKFDLFRVIQASREAAEARRRALEDLGHLWQARIELDRVMGRS